MAPKSTKGTEFRFFLTLERRLNMLVWARLAVRKIWGWHGWVEPRLVLLLFIAHNSVFAMKYLMICGVAFGVAKRAKSTSTLPREVFETWFGNES
jgi:hypothetical protein